MAASTDILVRQLKEAGLRVTPQRLAIYSALAGTNTHPTAQALFEQLQPVLPSLSQATVYNTLQVLVSASLIQKIGETGDGAVRYDANPLPHINLICSQCHCVEDFFDVPLDGIAEEVIAQSGYKVYSMRISYYGLCPSCQ